jgi:hypothetical protein
MEALPAWSKLDAVRNSCTASFEHVYFNKIILHLCKVRFKWHFIVIALCPVPQLAALLTIPFGRITFVSIKKLPKQLARLRVEASEICALA